jgi:hypothetical protein
MQISHAGRQILFLVVLLMASLQHSIAGQQVYPSAGAGQSLTPNGSASTFSAWQQVIAATPEAWLLSGISWGLPALANEWWILEVGVWDGAAYDPIAAIGGKKGSDSVNLGGGMVSLPIPIDLMPTGSDVAIRIKKSGTDVDPWAVKLHYFKKADDPTVIATTAKLFCTEPVSMTGDATPWADSGWAEAVASAGGALTVAALVPCEGTASGDRWVEVDVGTGAAASEAVRHTQALYNYNQFFGDTHTPMLTWPVNTGIASGSRVALRHRKEGTSTGTVLVMLMYYLDVESAVLSDLATTVTGQVVPVETPVTIDTQPFSTSTLVWTELFSSTPAVLHITSAVLQNAATAQLVFGTGTAGSEVEIGRMFGTSGTENHAERALVLRVPAGVRLAVGAFSLNAAQDILAKFNYLAGASPTQAADADLAYVPTPAVAWDAIDLTPSSTPWADSASVQAVDGSLEAEPWSVTAIGHASPVIAEFEIDLVAGANVFTVAGGSEANTTTDHFLKLAAPFRVPAGTDLDVRMRKAGTDTSVWSVRIERYDGELAVVDEAFEVEAALRGEDVALAWVEFEGQDDDGNDETFVWSGIALADPDTYYGGFKDAKLILVSDLVSAFSDRPGRLQATKASFELSDLPDADGNRSIAAFFDRSTGYVVRNTPITIRLISDRGRRALRTPVTIFRGMVDEAASVDEYRIRFECVSWLERRLDQPIVERRIGEDFPEADEDARQLPVPLCLGRLSDEASTTAGPVVTDDEAGRGVFAILSDVIGYGDLGGDPPTSLVPVEDVGNGEIVAGRYYFMAWSIDAAGAESDPEPFVPNANVLDVSADAAIDVTFAKGASAVTTRVAIGQRGPGTPLVYWHHIMETAGTSVRFTRLIEPPTGYLNPHDVTPGSFWPYGIGYRRLQVVAVVDGEETLPSIVVVAFIDPYHRPMRFAWEAVIDATEYRVYLASSNYRPNPPAFHFDRRISVPITQTNSNGDPYVSALFTDPAWEVVDGLENVARGVVPLRFVGYFTDLTGRSVGGFIVAGHTLATSGIINLYQDQVVITDDHYTAGDYMAPGKPSFSTYFTNTYQTINGHRYVLVYIAATGVNNPNLDDAITGSRPLYANCYGADDVGDGTGAEITSKYQLLKLLLRNLLAPSVPVLGTNWLTASPTFADGVAMIDEVSLDDAEAEAGNLITNGPAGGRYLAVDLTWAQLFPDWCPSAKAHIGVTLQGQVRAGVINPDAAAVVTVTEQREIIKGSFGWRDRAQAFGNAVAYQAVPVYSLSGISAYADADELEHTASQTRHRGERNLQPALTLTWIREPGTARQIASAFLEEGAYLPREVRQSSVLHWVHRRLGDVIGVVHREGAARTGWTSESPRKHAVLGMRISIPSNRVEYVCLDLRRRLGDLSDFELELLMSVIPLGGSMLDSCLEDPDTGSPVIITPPDWLPGVVNWDEIPSGGGAGSAYELVFDVNVKIQPGSPVGSPPPTVQPGLFLINQSQIDTPVAAGTATSSAVRERQQIVVDRPVGGGVKSYWMLPILDNGAVATDAYVYGVLRKRKVGAE